MFQVEVGARGLEPFAELVGPERVAAVRARAVTVGQLVSGSAVWNVNSTAAGGGVAEMLRSLLRYARGVGIDVRWLVMEGTPDFFRVTKRLHNALHDEPGDGSPLGPSEAEIYERVTRDNELELERFVRPGDVVICHDPQTAGLVPFLVRRGAHVVWRCHIGHEDRGVNVDAGWAFLRPYLGEVPLAVFSRGAYAPPWLPRTRTVVLPPNIDAFSVKNEAMPETAVRDVLVRSELVTASMSARGPVFIREDGTTGHVERHAHVVRAGAPPAWHTPLVVQVSRWDRMKDHAGVLEAFARLASDVAGPIVDAVARAELVLAGPEVRGVSDDPEGPVIFAEVQEAWRALPPAIQARAHLAELPMADTDENAAIVNALQRHATVIVQKSLREGFGLTVTEAMWKRRPIVASAVGGIQDQIRDGVDGLLVYDPSNPAETAAKLRLVLSDPALGVRLGDAAYERVRTEYLSVSSLERWADLLELLVREGASAA
jgi:trehalose synthase